ncbi:MAG: DUF2505 domain-containing protein [Polyangiaceae bacterium]
MASTFTCRDEFDCSEHAFWHDCTFSEDFNKRLYFDVLKFPGWKVLEQKDVGDGVLVRRVHIDPPVAGLPGPVAKAIGDKFSYVEEGRFDPKKNRYEFSVKPSTAADKSKTTGALWTEPLGENRCVRHAKVDVEVKIFMIGGMVEEKIVSDLKKSYEATARFIGQYLKEKKA